MAQKDRWFSSLTQMFWACEALTEGRTVSHKSEIREAEDLRLVASAGRLKDTYHRSIASGYSETDNTEHDRLPEGTDPTTLSYQHSAKSPTNEVAK